MTLEDTSRSLTSVLQPTYTGELASRTSSRTTSDAVDLFRAHDGAYYDHQRRALLRKHGIDLEDGSGAATLRKSRAYADLLRDGGEETDEAVSERVLTWRERNRKKLCYSIVGTNN